ncbi:hypothetical protein RRG08_007430 [Elysia crispata]|uniref:Uncharacterized protein n=1 Tax=Elysia crispata TaxID=231223 RepID=A0AAE0XMS9_9GAST|nr:hypothetical protein RRG08_007430 [Elysia crispata]
MLFLLPGIFKLHIPGTKKNLNIRKKEMEERDQQIGCKRKASAETEACPSFKLQKDCLMAIGHWAWGKWTFFLFWRPSQDPANCGWVRKSSDNLVRAHMQV